MKKDGDNFARQLEALTDAMLPHHGSVVGIDAPRQPRLLPDSEDAASIAVSLSGTDDNGTVTSFRITSLPGNGTPESLRAIGSG